MLILLKKKKILLSPPFLITKSAKILKSVFKQIGGLLMLQGGLMLLPLLVSLIYGEYYTALGFITSAAITASLGLIFYNVFYDSPEPHNKYALIIAATGWLSLAILGALPFFLTAYLTPIEVAREFIPEGKTYTSSLLNFRNPLHALFESMSAYTTTGLTMAVHEPSIGKGLLFYRSLGQWIGGVGFIVLSLAILRQSPGQGILNLYGSEYSGEKLRPNIIGTTRAIWKIYLGLTLFTFFILFLGGILIMPDYGMGEMAFNAINHAMTGQATGGFSTLDDSIAGYNSLPMELLHYLPMIMGALSLPFYFKLFNEKSIRVIWRDIQTAALLSGIILGGLLLVFLLFSAGNVTEPFRVGFFQYISGLTGTGWQTGEIGLWSSEAIIFLVCGALIIGGAAGSTTGGIKLVRALVIARGVWWQINKHFLPKDSIQTVHFDHQNFSSGYMHKWLSEVAIMAFLYLTLILLGTLITLHFCQGDLTMADAFFESASAQGTVGLSTGITDPDMAKPIELFYILQMWTGRLEIFPVLALFRTFIFGMRMVKF